MAELIAKSAFDAVLPVRVSEMSLTEVQAGVMTSVAPFRGQKKAVSDAMKSTHGMAFPGPNRATGKAGARAIWIGQGQAMLIGPAPAGALTGLAALSDQSDAWAVVVLEGEGVEDVLARLVPLDLRASVFKRGHTARTDLQHMMASVTRIGDRAFQIMVFRSMAQTLVHDLKCAMEAVAARR